MQQKELEMARLKSAFLKLANNTLAQKPVYAKSDTASAQRITTNTPKKRRFEDDKGSEVDDRTAATEPVLSATPPRSRSNTVHSTPHTIKRDCATPGHLRSAFATPGRPPLTDTTNRMNNCSVLSDKPAESPKMKQQPVQESLADRLKQVEESLQKLQVLGDMENIRAAAATLKSPQRSRIYNNLHRDNAGVTTQNTSNNSSTGNETNEQQPPPLAAAVPAPPVSTALPIPPAFTSDATSNNHGTHVPAPTHRMAPTAPVLGTGSNLMKPQLAEHLVLQAAIQRATKASIKTLLKSREVLPNASEARDQLAAYQQDSAKISTSLSPTNPNPAEEASTQAKSLETSIVHYHHTTSGLYPLTPLGDQSIRGRATSPVPLSELSILKDKMTSWRSKYAAKPGVPASV